jgi:hypothetical protein
VGAAAAAPPSQDDHGLHVVDGRAERASGQLGTVYNELQRWTSRRRRSRTCSVKRVPDERLHVVHAGRHRCGQSSSIVGDFHGFLVAQRAGMSIEFVPMLFDVTNNRPTGQRGWFAYARVGSDVIDPTAFQLLQNKTS